MRRIALLIAVAAWSWQSPVGGAFPVLPSSQHKRSPTKSSSSSTSVKSSLVNFEELLYSAQSAGSDLASLSLQDPSNLLTSMPIMYGAGLLTSFSPCVWGLLPLTMSYISQAAGERQDKQATLPTLAFAAGLAAVFCSLGVAVATLGGVFGSTATSSSAGGFFLPLLSNGICLAMGLQLLGFVQLSLPSADNNNNNPLASSSQDSPGEPILIDATGQILPSPTETKKEASLFRTFLLGGSSALVASPCATPVLTSILAFVANAQNAGVGALLLLGYTLGYSTPLLLVASTGGQALVDLRRNTSDGTSIYGKIAPWVTPLTGGVLLWYGTNGLLVALFGDPSLAGLAPILE
ncbi:ccda-like chloroplastic protein 2 [Seminavis robusta]|uniref:Ccda-like chloroplastic protein 2 n=1 Tax=Seminavis robusta TaxID=568900 RepID=A0A9N8DBG9_9STRA|nr:ccda-like chloroplastic protein 2 [Seminavis robusta]|eukprot:Sro20_g013840.1 ccda-like chloroplastic protein 2 (350) ;mRNA; f:13947-14996